MKALWSTPIIWKCGDLCCFMICMVFCYVKVTKSENIRFYCQFSTESSNKLTGWHLLQVVILWNSCCFNKKYLQNVQTVSSINVYKINKIYTERSLLYSAPFSCPHRTTHHSYTYWYSPTPGPMFVGDITIDNIVFSNPMTIYLLTMANVRACICKYYKCQTSLFRPEFAPAHVLLYNVGGKLNTWHEVFYEDVFFLSLVTTFILFII